MKSRIYLLLFFLLLLNLIRCGCPETGVFYYSWNGFDTSYYRWVRSEGDWWTPWPTDETAFYGPNFGIEVLMQTQQIAQSSYKIDFSNASLAWSKCPDDAFVPKLQITDFNIYTRNEFDDQHLANSDITEYFYPEDTNETYTLNYLNAVEGVGVYKSLSFRLTKVPTKGTVHQFNIEFVLENGTKISGETKEISLFPEK